MLAGLALKWRWRARRGGRGPAHRPAQHRAGQQRAGGLGEVLPVLGRRAALRARSTRDRYIDHPRRRCCRTSTRTRSASSPILGTTFTGEYEPIKEIAEALDRAQRGDRAGTCRCTSTPPAAASSPRSSSPTSSGTSGCPLVKSINVSGHKYGLTYPGVGFVVWRDQEDLPEDLVFHVNYLGGDMPTFTLNFSRPGNQIVGQYYNFIRLGREGYTRIMETLRDIAMHLSDAVAKMGPFELISDGIGHPGVRLRPARRRQVHGVRRLERLRQYGWQVPAYTMPADAEDLAVLRIVVREGFSADLADKLLADLSEVVDHLEKHGRPPGEDAPVPFAHT